MGTINAALIKAILQDSSITDTNAEIQCDQAINRLNTYGAGLSNLSGAAGSKSGTYSSAEEGAIIEVTRLTYYGYYQRQESTSMPLATTQPNLLTDPVTENRIRQLAFQLAGKSFQRS